MVTVRNSTANPVNIVETIQTTKTTPVPPGQEITLDPNTVVVEIK